MASWRMEAQWTLREAGWSDRITLPSAALGELVNIPAVKLPLILDIRCPDRGSKAYCGVLEGSADPGVVGLPEKVVSDLGLQGGEKLVLRVANGVPKATRLLLQPMTADFYNAPDHRALLERQLTQRYTCLSPGDIVRVEEGGVEYDLLVGEAAPVTPALQAVCILNTNVSVEFGPALNAGAADGRQAARWLNPTKPTPDAPPASAQGSLPGDGARDLFRIPLPSFCLESQVGSDDLQAAGVASGGRTAAGAAPVTHLWGVRITLTPTQGDADLYLGALPLSAPGPADAVVAATSPGPSTLLVAPTHSTVLCTPPLVPPSDAGVGTGAGCTPPPPVPLRRVLSSAGDPVTVSQLPWKEGAVFSLAVTAFGGPATYTVEVTVEPVPVPGPTKPGAGAGEAAATGGGPDTLPCPLCGAQVPSHSLARHEAFCARNNVRCSHSGCGVVLRKGSEEAAMHWHCPTCSEVMLEHHHPKHAAQHHTPLHCTCGFTGDLAEVRSHKAASCPHRYITCRFCHLAVRAGGRPSDSRDILDGFTAHEAECGGRTTLCGVCGQRVKLKLLLPHASTYHPEAGMDEVAATPPPEGPHAKLPRLGGTSAVGEEEEGEGGYALPPPPTRTPCCNIACSATAAPESADAGAAALGACARCARLVRGAAGGEVVATPEGVKALFGGLVKAYHAQLTAGCGKAGCSNPACLTSVPGGSVPLTPTAAAGPAVELAKRGLGGAGQNRQVFLCVGVSRAPPTPLGTPTTGCTVLDGWRRGLEAAGSQQPSQPAAAPKTGSGATGSGRGAKRRVAGEFFEG